MASPDEDTHYVDRRETLLGSPVASQISSDGSVIRESGSCDVEISFGGGEADVSSEDHQQSSVKTERSEVNVEIQGLRETSLSTSKTVVTNRVTSVYDRSLSGSTSSTDLEPYSAVLLDTSHGADDAVFGEHASITEHRQDRKSSDSYYISQTYQVNTEATTTKSVTTVRSVSFTSSKDVFLGDHGEAAENAELHFVDRLEGFLPGESPEVVGSPKENSVRFLWFDSDQDNVESLKKIQSAKKDVQQLIENTNMVSDIANVVDDIYIGPEAKRPIFPTVDENSRDRHQQEGIISDVQRESTDTDVDRRHFNENIGGRLFDVSDSDVLEMLNKQSLSTNEITWSTSYSRSQYSSMTQVSTKPTDFTQEVKALDVPSSGRSSPPTLAYSPGMAIRSYALEELAEKKVRMSPDKAEAEAKTLRFDKESSGVDLDKGSSVDEMAAMNSHSCLSTVSGGSLLSEASSNSMYSSSEVIQNKKTEDKESLEKLVDLESILIGYRFHDVGIMQESEDVNNIAFDDSDYTENLMLNDSEHRSSLYFNAQARSLVDASPSVSETGRQFSDAYKLPSAVEDFYKSGLEKSSPELTRDNVHVDAMYVEAAAEIRPTLQSENITQVNELKKMEVTTKVKGLLEQHTTIVHTGEVTANTSQVVVRGEHKNNKHSHRKEEHPTEQIDSPDSRLVVNETACTSDYAGKDPSSEYAQLSGAITLSHEDRETTRPTNETEDIRDLRSAETNQTMHFGEYSSGYYVGVGESHLLHDDSRKHDGGRDNAIENSIIEIDTAKQEENVDTRADHAVVTSTKESVKLTNVGEENVVSVVEEKSNVSQVCIGKGDASGVGEVGAGRKKRKAEQSGKKNMNESVAIKETVGAVAGKQDEHVEGGSGKADVVRNKKTAHLKKKADKAANKRRSDNVVSVDSAMEVDSGSFEKQVENGESGTLVESGTSTREVENMTSIAKVESVTSVRKVESVASKTQIESVTSIIEVESETRITSQAYNMTVSAIDNNALLDTENNNTTNYSKTENVSRVSAAQNAAIADNIRTGRYSGLSRKVISSGHTSRDEVQSRAKEAMPDAPIVDQPDRYNVEPIEANTRVDIRKLLESETSSTLESEHIERIIQGLAPAELELVREEFRVIGVSNTLRKYMRVNRLENVINGNVTSSVIMESKTEVIGTKEASRNEQSKAEVIETKETSRGEQSKAEDVGTKETSRNKQSKAEDVGTKETSRNKQSKSEDVGTKETSSKKQRKAMVVDVKETSRDEQSEAEDVSAKEASSKEQRKAMVVDVKETSRDEQSKAEVFEVKQSSRKEQNKAEVADVKEASEIKKALKQDAGSKWKVSVTRKFNISNKFEASLKSFGASLKSESKSIAVYFDTEDFDLTLSDCWLRSVNSEWQFHANFTKLLNNQTKSQYTETDDRSAILSALGGFLKVKPPSSGDVSIASFIQTSGLGEFVRYTTIRRSYAMGDMTIDLEMPEYGFWVGTVTFEGSTSLNNAVRNIDSFWEATGVDQLNLLAVS